MERLAHKAKGKRALISRWQISKSINIAIKGAFWVAVNNPTAPKRAH